MSTNTRVAVIGGGQNCEHAVSLSSAASVRTTLAAVFEIVELTIRRDGGWESGGQPLSLAGAVELMTGCDVVLPIVHGPHGEDGSLAALCDLAGVRHSGSGVRAGALAMDKWVTKLVAEEVGIRTAPASLVTRATAHTLTFTHPVVVKPVAAGSSHGVTLVREAEELEPALATALALDDRVLVEDLVRGREIDVAVLQRADGTLCAGPPLEIVVGDALFDTTRKYDGTADFRLPADLTGVEHKDLVSAALAMFEVLGCAGVARVDFFLTEAGLVLNEVNTMPGLTEQSQVPKMFASAGIPYLDLLVELVRGAQASDGP